MYVVYKKETGRPKVPKEFNVPFNVSRSTIKGHEVA
jgi:hypothetical protein